ncbi:MAG: hypothetical protein JNL19_10715 [Burkholderiales bacterium]|nr:hypothetical protein [Burkholderiales bacterium]
MNDDRAKSRDASQGVSVAELRGIYEVRERIANRRGYGHVAATCRSLLEALKAIDVTEVVVSVTELSEGIEMTISEFDSGLHLYSVCFCSGVMPEREQAG